MPLRGGPSAALESPVGVSTVNPSHSRIFLFASSAMLAISINSLCEHHCKSSRNITTPLRPTIAHTHTHTKPLVCPQTSIGCTRTPSLQMASSLPKASRNRLSRSTGPRLASGSTLKSGPRSSLSSGITSMSTAASPSNARIVSVRHRARLCGGSDSTCRIKSCSVWIKVKKLKSRLY